jgi:hypothetical protein
VFRVRSRRRASKFAHIARCFSAICPNVYFGLPIRSGAAARRWFLCVRSYPPTEGAPLLTMNKRTNINAQRRIV